METVRPVTPPVQASVPEPSRAPPSFAAERDPQRRPLDAPVSLDLSDEAARAAQTPSARTIVDEQPQLERGFERDRDTQTLVYRLTDVTSGDVLLQFPNEAVMKARAYARQAEASSLGERVERTA